VAVNQQLRRTALVVLLACVALLLQASPARAWTYADDYPYRTQTNASAADKWGFTQRQCVSYAAWRVNKSGHTFTNKTVRNGRTYYWGNAKDWDTTAYALGKRVTTTPKVGAIAQWNAYEKSAYYPSGGGTGTMQAGAYGHVAVVARVLSYGKVLVRQYNMSGNRSYSELVVKAPRYIYAY
jgi:surface antigen